MKKATKPPAADPPAKRDPEPDPAQRERLITRIKAMQAAHEKNPRAMSGPAEAEWNQLNNDLRLINEAAAKRAAAAKAAAEKQAAEDAKAKAAAPAATAVKHD